MRHKYSTRAVVLARSPIGEASSGVTLLTEEFGIVRARAQGLRKSGAKMASALQSLSTADVTLIRGKDGWRLTGAILDTPISTELDTPKRMCAGRIFELVQRLVRGEHQDQIIYAQIRAFIETLPTLSGEELDAAECLAAVRILQVLGHDAGDVPGSGEDYARDTLAQVAENRTAIIKRINTGISISGL